MLGLSIKPAINKKKAVSHKEIQPSILLNKITL